MLNQSCCYFTFRGTRDKSKGSYKMHPCHLIAQSGSSAPSHMPSIMDASQSIAVPSTGFAGRPKRGSVYWPKPPSKPRTNGLLLHDKIDFLSNRRPWRGIAIVARSEKEWTVDSSGFPLLHYVSDMNNSSVTNRKKSGILWWTGLNKAVKHLSADAFQCLLQLFGF